MQKNIKKHVKLIKEKFKLEQEKLQNKEQSSPTYISKRSSDIARPNNKRTKEYIKP